MLGRCTICQIEAAKYKCPACSRVTCSLKCSKSHKSEFQCSGVVDVSKYIPRSNIDNTTVDRDYTFLQDVKRELQIGKRSLEDMQGGVRFSKRHAKRPQINGVHVTYLPSGMQRSLLNKSHYNVKVKKFFWTIEWKIEGGGLDQSITKSNIQDSAIVWESALQLLNSLELPKGMILEQKQEICQAWHYYLCDYKSHQLVELDRMKTFDENFRGKSVLEFPTIIMRETEIQGKINTDHSFKIDGTSDATGDSAINEASQYSSDEAPDVSSTLIDL